MKRRKLENFISYRVSQEQHQLFAEVAGDEASVNDWCREATLEKLKKLREAGEKNTPAETVNRTGRLADERALLEEIARLGYLIEHGFGIQLSANRTTVCLRLAGAFAKFQTAPLHPRHTIFHLPMSKRKEDVYNTLLIRLKSSGVRITSSGSGTYHGTSTKTTYEEKKYEHTTLFIKAFVHNVIEVDGKKDIDRLPLFTAQHKGQWRWSKPDKDAFVKAMEFIQKQLK